MLRAGRAAHGPLLTEERHGKSICGISQPCIFTRSPDGKFGHCPLNYVLNSSGCMGGDMHSLCKLYELGRDSVGELRS